MGKTPDQVINEAFVEYYDCLEVGASEASLEEVQGSCFAGAFDTNFVETLTKALTGDNSDAGKELKELFGDMISNVQVCMENKGPGVNERPCEEEFETVLDEISGANKK